MNSDNDSLLKIAASKIVEALSGHKLVLSQARGFGLSITATPDLHNAISELDHPSAKQVAAIIKVGTQSN